MISFAIFLVICAVIFWVITLFATIDGIWWWYIPTSFFLVTLYCQLIYAHYKSLADGILKKYPDLLDDDEKTFFKINAGIYLPPFQFIMKFITVEHASSISYVNLGSIIYSIVCCFFQQWWVAIFSISLFPYTLLVNIGNAFYSTPQDNVLNSIRRYYRLKKQNLKNATETDLALLEDKYNSIQSKLETIFNR